MTYTFLDYIIGIGATLVFAAFIQYANYVLSLYEKDSNEKA